MLFFSMLLLGAVIGFVGAGGAGVTITLLTVGFHVPIHTALAVALASMVFTMLSGTISHFRQKEVIVKTGAIIGLGPDWLEYVLAQLVLHEHSAAAVRSFDYA